MAKDPAFLFYSQDFIVGVQTLTMEERGQYITLLCMQHQQGRLTDQTIRLLVGSISDNLRSKFTVDKDGFLYNKRLENESNKRSNFVNSRRDNGAKGGRPTKEKTDRLSKTKPNTNLMEDENEIENEDVNANEIEISPTFQEFWDEYGKKVGDRDKLAKKWLKIAQRDKEAIMQHLPKYKQAQPDKKFRKNPDTYLNNKSWLDEIISSHKNISNTSEEYKRKNMAIILGENEQHN